MNIIVKKNPSHSLFRPHFNNATGKRYHVKEDYLKDIKAMGLEPYKGEVKKREVSPYKPSKWAHEMVEESKGKKKLGDRFYNELNRVSGYKPKLHNEIIGKTRINNQEGGFIE